MRRFFAALAFGALVLAPQGVSSTQTVYLIMDGVWWQGLTPYQKQVAVEGMVEGFEAGYRTAALQVYEDSLSKPTATSLALSTEYRAISRAAPSFIDRTFATMADRIDSVYREHPKLNKVHVGYFALCAGTSGKNCSDYATLLERESAKGHI